MDAFSWTKGIVKTEKRQDRISLLANDSPANHGFVRIPNGFSQSWGSVFLWKSRNQKTNSSRLEIKWSSGCKLSGSKSFGWGKMRLTSLLLRTYQRRNIFKSLDWNALSKISTISILTYWPRQKLREIWPYQFRRAAFQFPRFFAKVWADDGVRIGVGVGFF